MRTTRALVVAFGLTVVVTSSGCFTSRRPTADVEEPPSVAPLPPLALPPATPDAAPKAEPKSRYGNPPYYDVFGKRYYVLSSSVAYVERGVASWYGPGFHKVKTSNGEMYDMYGMTAAHKTLPLPAYVRVTNLQNGRSVVVRVNDRGPFVGNRIIDLSYTAASKLDMLHNGTAMVEVRALDAGAPYTDSTGAGVSLGSAPPPPAVTTAAVAAMAPSATAPLPTTGTPLGSATAPVAAAAANTPPGSPAPPATRGRGCARPPP